MEPSSNYVDPFKESKLEPISFIKQPRVISKLLCALLSLITLGCASSGCSVGSHYIFNDDPSACHYAISISLLGLFFAVLSIVSDYMYERTSNVKRRRNILLADVAGCGLFAFLDFVCFCYLSFKWSHTTSKWLTDKDFGPWQRRNARSVIFFSFVSIVAWAVVTFLALLRFRKSGQGLLSATLSHPGMMSGEPQAASQDLSGGEYSGYPSSAPNGYNPPMQQQPQQQMYASSQYPTNGLTTNYHGGVGNSASDQYYPPTF